MFTKHITVNEKIAKYHQRDGDIICGNSGYQIEFIFDSEWDAYPEKTARFIWNGKYFDQKFTDNICPAPVISDADEVTVGVYAGDITTTTPAKIPCKRSILCGTNNATDGKVREYRDEAVKAAEFVRESLKEYGLNGTVPVEKGGTGATTKEEALANLGLKTKKFKFTYDDSSTETVEVYVK